MKGPFPHVPGLCTPPFHGHFHPDEFAGTAYGFVELASPQICRLLGGALLNQHLVGGHSCLRRALVGQTSPGVWYLES
jgi:hypothetical protein